MMICEECHVGRYQLTTAPYLRQLGKRVMIIPNITALVCDVCGEVDYDPDFMVKLQYLIEQYGTMGEEQSTAQRQRLQPGNPAPRQRARRSV